MPLAGRHGAEHSILWFLNFGALLVAGLTASVRTPVEGKSGADTAAWTRVIKGHSQERRHGKRSGLVTPASIWFARQSCNLGVRRGNTKFSANAREYGLSDGLELFYQSSSSSAGCGVGDEDAVGYCADEAVAGFGQGCGDPPVLRRKWGED